MIEFDPESVETWDTGKVPETSLVTEIDDALEEINPVVEELTADISGIGQKAAQRYVLQFQYGFSTKQMADRFDVTPQTVSNQIGSVRKKIVKYPWLARILGTLRAQRADLQRPDFEHGAMSEGSVNLLDDTIEYTLTYRNGSVGRPYSWQYAITATYQREDRKYHLNTTYIVDAIYGVFLKRTYTSISLVSWTQPPHMSRYDYEIYPLPNVEVPTTDGTLLEATEHHAAYDIRNNFELLLEGDIDWDDLIEPIRYGKPHHYKPSLARGEVLIDRVRRCQGDTPVADYTEAVHIRRNLERLMRTYPMTSPWDLPDETITLLWNGQPTNHEDHTKIWQVEKQELYNMIRRVRSVHKGRDVYPTNRDSVKSTHIW